MRETTNENGGAPEAPPPCLEHHQKTMLQIARPS